MIRSLLIAICAFAALASAAPAAAQSGDSATVDVTATIVQTRAELSVSGTAALLFGNVSLPGASAASCTYSVFPTGSTFISADGDKDSCAFTNADQAAGAFEITCEADAALVLTISFQDTINVGIPGLVFSTSEFDTSLDGQSYDGNFTCAAGGVSQLTVGGTLFVDASARRTFEPVQVGLITLEASY